jgi:hypothetical protein
MAETPTTILSKNSPTRCHHHGWQWTLGASTRPAARGEVKAGTENLRRVIRSTVEFGVKYFNDLCFFH